MLNERGIKAVTPSALNTPAGQNHSPTVTPCNSPEGSPTRDRSPEPLLSGIFYSGADMIRRKLVGDSNGSERCSRSIPTRNKILLSRQEKRALRSLRLVEKVESMGLENIMHVTSNTTVGVSPLVRTRTVSPMSQLTSLKNIRRCDDPYAIDKETIKAVLNKGLSQESLFSESSTTSSIRNLDLTLQEESNSTNSNITNTKTPQKIKQMQRQKSRRSLLNGGGAQRPDLGVVTNTSKSNIPKVGSHSHSPNVMIQTSVRDSNDATFSVELVAPQQTSYTQSFVGSISSLFFGRKGGLL